MDPAAIRFPEGKADDPFTEDHWEAFVAVAQALGIEVGSGGGIQVANGGISSTRRPWIWIRLTSVSSGSYAWTRVVRDPAGTGWLDSVESGTATTNPARPANSTVTISTFPYYVRARRETSGEVVFLGSAC